MLEYYIKSIIKEDLGVNNNEAWNIESKDTYYPPEMGGCLSFRKEIFPNQVKAGGTLGLPSKVYSDYKRKYDIIAGDDQVKWDTPMKPFKLIIGWHPPEGYDLDVESEEVHNAIYLGPSEIWETRPARRKKVLKQTSINNKSLIDYILERRMKNFYFSDENDNPVNLNVLHITKRESQKPDDEQQFGAWWEVWCNYDIRYSHQNKNRVNNNLFDIRWIGHNLYHIIFKEYIKNYIIGSLGADEKDLLNILC